MVNGGIVQTGTNDGLFGLFCLESMCVVTFLFWGFWILPRREIKGWKLPNVILAEFTLYIDRLQLKPHIKFQVIILGWGRMRPRRIACNFPYSISLSLSLFAYFAQKECDLVYPWEN